MKIAIFTENNKNWIPFQSQFIMNNWEVSIYDTFDFNVILYFSPDLLLIDLSPPFTDALAFFSLVKKESPGTNAIFTSSYATLSLAVQAMKAGALDFLSFPLSIDDLIYRIKEYDTKLQKRPEEIKKKFQKSFHLVKGQSKSMQKIFERAALVSEYDTIIMIVGETGSGKEVLARSIHMERAPKKSFASIHLGNIPDDLAEAELFGYEKGAFTGAYQSKPGKFEVVEDGTLFLDDIDDASLRLQTKLLRVLQEKEFERLGGIKTYKARSRIIISAKPSILKKVQDGEFREDLYYRINVVPIKLPPLRDRKEDIVSLIDHFIIKYSKKFNKKLNRINDAALKRLTNYDYPGNVRELEHIIERIACFSSGESISEADISREFGQLVHKDHQMNCLDCLCTTDKLPHNLYDLVERVSERHIQWAWKRSDKKAFRAAKLLGIPRTSLLLKLKKYKLK